MLRTAAAGCAFDRTRPGAVMPSPHQQAARGAVKTAAHQSDQTTEQRRRPETVEPVHHAAMAGNEMAGIFGAELALDPGFEKVAKLRHDRQQQRNDRNRGPY